MVNKLCLIYLNLGRPRTAVLMFYVFNNSYDEFSFSSQSTSRRIGWLNMATWKSNLPATGIDSETMAMSFNKSNINEVAPPWQ